MFWVFKKQWVLIKISETSISAQNDATKKMFETEPFIEKTPFLFFNIYGRVGKKKISAEGARDTVQPFMVKANYIDDTNAGVKLINKCMKAVMSPLYLFGLHRTVIIIHFIQEETGLSDKWRIDTGKLETFVELVKANQYSFRFAPDDLSMREVVSEVKSMSRK